MGRNDASVSKNKVQHMAWEKEMECDGPQVADNSSGVDDDKCARSDVLDTESGVMCAEKLIFIMNGEEKAGKAITNVKNEVDNTNSSTTDYLPSFSIILIA